MCDGGVVISFKILHRFHQQHRDPLIMQCVNCSFLGIDNEARINLLYVLGNKPNLFNWVFKILERVRYGPEVVHCVAVDVVVINVLFVTSSRYDPVKIAIGFDV